MKVNATINSLCNHKTLKATAQLTFDNCFVVKGLKVFEGEKGLYVGMPNERLPIRGEHEKFEYKDTAFPITKEARDSIVKIVLDAYELAKEKAKEIDIGSEEDSEEAQM